MQSAVVSSAFDLPYEDDYAFLPVFRLDLITSVMTRQSHTLDTLRRHNWTVIIYLQKLISRALSFAESGLLLRVHVGQSMREKAFWDRVGRRVEDDGREGCGVEGGEGDERTEPIIYSDPAVLEVHRACIAQFPD